MDEFTLLRRIEALEAQVTLLSQHAGVPCPMFASTGFAVSTNPMAPPMTTPMTAPHVGGPPPQLSPAQLEIVDLARSGKKIEAIKRYRELTGADLAEAKRFIESI